jgi:hypothetical protein
MSQSIPGQPLENFPIKKNMLLPAPAATVNTILFQIEPLLQA